MRSLKMKEKSRKVRPGDVFVYPMRTDVCRQGVNSFTTPWNAIEVVLRRQPDSSFLDVEFVGNSNSWFGQIFEGREEALLYLESLGKKPTVLDFEPSLSKIVHSGTVEKWEPGDKGDEELRS